MLDASSPAQTAIHACRLTTEVIATPSELREQGREAYRLFVDLARCPYQRPVDTCAFENWTEGFLQAQWAAEWERWEVKDCHDRNSGDSSVNSPPDEGVEPIECTVTVILVTAILSP